ncbi:MAG: hypothetical protein M3467_10735, partial [Actinomycetota bacterium]|nr:hypothetical protein [Actinomycetota bacterium]
MPAKLAARVRLFDTGPNRKTDARVAHSIAIVAVRTEGLRVLKVDGELEALRMRSSAGSWGAGGPVQRGRVPGRARAIVPQAGTTCG